FSADRSHMATWQPAALSCSASARPIPVPPPVMTAILSRKSFMVAPSSRTSRVGSTWTARRRALAEHPGEIFRRAAGDRQDDRLGELVVVERADPCRDARRVLAS